ncbi:MAG: hypothetical protein ACR2FI_04295 [Burkholderiales bacterium]|nr:hypothetical protein [Pseudomonadota bacterium]
MKKIVFFVAAMLPALAFAHQGYPTVDRVEWVLACMQQSDKGGYELVHKCSCAIDKIAAKLKHDDYIEYSTAARGQTMRGERGNEFRDPETVKGAGAKYKKIQAEAREQCFLE